MAIFPNPLDSLMPKAPEEPAVRAEVAGLSFDVVETATRWDGCPNCAEKDAEIERLRGEKAEKSNG